MSQTRSQKWIILLIITTGVIFGLIFIHSGFIESFLIRMHDSKELSCEQLPNWTQAQNIYQDHIATIEQIKLISPGNVFIELRERCPGKGEMVIYYDTIHTRNQIKTILGDSFFGIPYVMYNI